MAERRFQQFGAGDVIYREGERCIGAFIIEDGEAEVFREAGNRRIPIARLKKGDIFGEMALIDGTVHGRSVRAYSALNCLHITEDDFKTMVASSHPFVQQLLKRPVRKLRNTTDAAFGKGTTPRPQYFG
jgi:CRP-like cAMP-binding protein